MFQIRGYGKCKGPEVEAYLVYSRKSREASTAETEEARIGEDRKRDRGTHVKRITGGSQRSEQSPEIDL